MNTPPDFAQTLDAVNSAGVLRQSPEEIWSRLEDSAVGAAKSTASSTADMGVITDTARKYLKGLEVALRKELCDPSSKSLKKTYDDNLGKAMTKDGVASVAAVVLKVGSAINPAFTVSTVAVLMAVWIMKVGLNSWCARG